MNIRKLMMVVAAASIAPVAAFAQSDSTGGSAGDSNKPLTYTKMNFSDLDKDNNGIADKKEVVGSKLDAALVKQIDTNGDGQISQAEFDSFKAMTDGNKLPARR